MQGVRDSAYWMSCDLSELPGMEAKNGDSKGEAGRAAGVFQRDDQVYMEETQVEVSRWTLTWRLS